MEPLRQRRNCGDICEDSSALLGKKLHSPKCTCRCRKPARDGIVNQILEGVSQDLQGPPLCSARPSADLIVSFSSPSTAKGERLTGCGKSMDSALYLRLSAKS